MISLSLCENYEKRKWYLTYHWQDPASDGVLLKLLILKRRKVMSSAQTLRSRDAEGQKIVVALNQKLSTEAMAR